MTTTLQTQDVALKGQMILVNGNRLSVDGLLRVVAPDDETRDKLLDTGWTLVDEEEASKRSQVKRRPLYPRPLTASRESAKALVETVAANPALQERFAAAETFGDVQKLANTLGYHFAQKHLDAELMAHAARTQSALSALGYKKADVVPEPKDEGEDGAPSGDGEVLDFDPAPYLAGDREWPDPSPEMPLDFLKAMADDYEVEYGTSIGAKKLAERIHGAMYPDD